MFFVSFSPGTGSNLHSPSVKSSCLTNITHTVSLCRRDEKIAIMREKHSALMRPMVFALDHVRSITATPAETPHETWFQQTYGDAITSALERLKNPANPANPASSWLPFKQVCVCH